MGKLADAIRGLAIPAQKQTQLLRLDRQYVELETQMESFTDENEAIRKENADLKDKNKTLQKKIDGLQDQLHSRAANNEKSFIHEALDDFQIHLISYLARVRDQDCIDQKIANALTRVLGEEVTAMKVSVNLKRLEDRDNPLVGFYPHTGIAISAHWFLTDRGKAYAVLHGLDKRE